MFRPSRIARYDFDTRLRVLMHQPVFERAGELCDFPRESMRTPEITQFAGTLEDWLVHQDAKSRVEVVPRDTAGAKHASLHYEVRRRYGGLALLELRPQTGRKH